MTALAQDGDAATPRRSVSPPPSCTASRGAPAVERGVRQVALRPKYGDGVSSVAVRYALAGAPGAPTLIVQGGISADRDVAETAEGNPGWWGALVGDGSAIDLKRWRVLAIDWIAPPEIDARAVSSEDQADALAGVLDGLGLDRAAAFVGASYGAMAALAFAARYPERLDRLVMLAGAHRAHPLSTAQRAIQRRIVEFGLSCGRGADAMALARQLAVATYRGADEFAARFAGSPERRDDRFHFPVEAYLEHQGRRFAERFDAGRFLALSESIDLHDVAPERVRTPATLIGFSSDRLVPVDDLRDLQGRLGAPATLEVVETACGHDGFLTEPARLAPLLRRALA